MIIMLHISDLSFRYTQKPILSDVSFSVEPGQLCGLFGPNGSGKTTLFKCCLRFLPIEQGSIRMNSVDVSSRSVEKLAKTVAYVPQEHKPPFPYLSREVVLMGRTPHIKGFFGIKRQDKQIARDAMDQLNILDIADEPYNQLSGGQRQMVLMARAIAQDTPLLFLDEPTSALDFQNQMKIWGLMEDIVAEGKTILACSHDPNHVAWFCDKVIVISNHGIVGEGMPDETINQDILDRIYHNTCSVCSNSGVPMVMPKKVALRMENY